MLAPGIYLMNTDADRMAALHPSWAHDMRVCGPWQPEGEWLKGERECDTPIVVAESCETTMELAREMVDSGTLGDWGAVMCAEQTLGRGQLRRPWVSIPGNLHASVLLPELPTQGLWAEKLGPLLPLVVGDMLCSVLEGLGAQLEIKWPNDILQNGRKVGGMLIEERNGRSILGFGLNLAGCPTDDEMREDHSVPAGEMALPSLSGGALTLLETLVNRGKTVYAILLDEIPPTKFLAKIERRLAWMGRTIRVRDGSDAPFEAVIMGLSPDGGLVLRRGGEEIVMHSGSILPF